MRLAASLLIGALALVGCSPAESKPAPEPETLDVWVVGDSITVGAEGHLAALLPNAVIDAEVGRPFAHAEEIVADLLHDGDPDVLVIALGANAGVSEHDFHDLMALVDHVPEVVFINVRVPRDWETTANSVLASGVRAYDNASLVDWHQHSAGLTSHFRDDGYHPNDLGSQLWTNLVVAALRD